MGSFKLAKMTMRSLFSKPATVRYPYEKRDIERLFPAMRGHVVNDVEACIMCGMCQRHRGTCLCIWCGNPGSGQYGKCPSGTADACAYNFHVWSVRCISRIFPGIPQYDADIDLTDY